MNDLEKRFIEARTRAIATDYAHLNPRQLEGVLTTEGPLLLLAGWNDTCYYPSLTDMQSSLAITNSSSSLFTLKVMSVVSLLIPFVAAYIWYAWRAMNRKPITREEIRGDDHQY